MRPSISLVVPAYNEEAGLRKTTDRCLATLRACTDDYELIILDDCSRDSTPIVMEEIRKTDPDHIRTARHATNQGIAVTFEDLYKMATKQYVFLIPGDGEYPPEALIECMTFLPDLSTHAVLLLSETEAALAELLRIERERVIAELAA